MVMRTAVTNGSERHHKQGENRHLTSSVPAGPLFVRVTDTKEGVEYGQNEAKHIEDD